MAGIEAEVIEIVDRLVREEGLRRDWNPASEQDPIDVKQEAARLGMTVDRLMELVLIELETRVRLA